jgi:hypothetical protein
MQSTNSNNSSSSRVQSTSAKSVNRPAAAHLTGSKSSLISTVARETNIGGRL